MQLKQQVLLPAASSKPRVVPSETCPVRDLSSPRVGVSASCPVTRPSTGDDGSTENAGRENDGPRPVVTCNAGRYCLQCYCFYRRRHTFISLRQTHHAG